MFDGLVEILLEWGLIGLIIAAFTESFCSPILPDVLLLPMALARPDRAIYYGLVATVVSVLGGFIGYWIGAKWGMSVVHKVMSDKYAEKIAAFAHSENIGWTVWVAAMSPIPYKIVSISAGAFRVKWSTFIIASVFGRAKRFFLEAVLIYYFGEPAVHFLQNSSREMLIGTVVVIAVLTGLYYLYKKSKRNKMQED